MEITKEIMEEALQFLAKTDVEFAQAKALYDGLSEQRKVIKAQWYMRSGQSSAANKTEDAYNSMAYRQHLDKMEAANLAMLTLQAQRSTQATVIDCWRSLNSARSKGQVV